MFFAGLPCLLCKQVLQLFVHSSNPGVKLYSADSILSVQKISLFMQNFPLSNCIQQNNVWYSRSCSHPCVNNTRWEFCSDIQNYHQLHLPPHTPKRNCQSQTKALAEVWRRGHLNGNHLPLFSWLVHDTSWFYKKTTLQSVLHLCGRNQFFWMTEAIADVDDLVL